MTPTVALGLVLLAVDIEGTGTCPSPEAVAERLRPLLPAEGGGGRVSLASGPEGLHISLVRAGGAAAVERTVVGEHSCDALADAAAVIIAAWQDGGAGPDRSPAPPVERAAGWEVGAGGGVSVDGGALAPSLLLSASVRPWGGVAGLGVFGFYAGSRSAPLAGGTVRWSRALLAVGPQLVWSASTLDVIAHAGGGLSWLGVEGVGLPAAESHGTFDGGLVAGLRVAISRQRAQPWIEAAGLFWPARMIVQVVPVAARTLPRVELLLSVGFSLGR